MTEPTSTVLSWTPKCLIAHSCRGVGVRSMTVDPTTSTGDDAGAVSAATRCPAATPTSTARTPNPEYSCKCTKTRSSGGGF